MDQKKTILIIEDEVSLNEALCTKFSLEHFRVLKAFNGKDGLEIALREKPDMILLDLLMPIMDGMTMLRKLRADAGWGAGVPVIILTNETGNNDERTRDIAETRPVHYLVKSNWKIEDVVKKVKERLEMV